MRDQVKVDPKKPFIFSEKDKYGVNERSPSQLRALDQSKTGCWILLIACWPRGNVFTTRALNLPPFTALLFQRENILENVAFSLFFRCLAPWAAFWPLPSCKLKPRSRSYTWNTNYEKKPHDSFWTHGPDVDTMQQSGVSLEQLVKIREIRLYFCRFQ